MKNRADGAGGQMNREASLGQSINRSSFLVLLFSINLIGGAALGQNQALASERSNQITSISTARSEFSRFESRFQALREVFEQDFSALLEDRDIKIDKVRQYIVPYSNHLNRVEESANAIMESALNGIEARNAQILPALEQCAGDSVCLDRMRKFSHELRTDLDEIHRHRRQLSATYQKLNKEFAQKLALAYAVSAIRDSQAFLANDGKIQPLTLNLAKGEGPGSDQSVNKCTRFTNLFMEGFPPYVKPISKGFVRVGHRLLTENSSLIVDLEFINKETNKWVNLKFRLNSFIQGLDELSRLTDRDINSVGGVSSLLNSVGLRSSPERSSIVEMTSFLLRPDGLGSRRLRHELPLKDDLDDVTDEDVLCGAVRLDYGLITILKDELVLRTRSL